MFLPAETIYLICNIYIYFSVLCRAVIYGLRRFKSVCRKVVAAGRDETYDKLYIKNQDLDVFYNSAKLGKMVEICLKKSNVYTPAQKNDILFYALYLSVAKRVGNANITFKDVKEIELNSYTDEYITQIAEIVFSEYEKLGGDGKVAKGSDLIDNLISIFSTPEDHSDLA